MSSVSCILFYGRMVVFFYLRFKPTQKLAVIINENILQFFGQAGPIKILCAKHKPQHIYWIFFVFRPLYCIWLSIVAGKCRGAFYVNAQQYI